MKVVVLQPSYIPWRGYFHQMYKADIFIFYDCVEYDKHGWRNRNKIKTQQGTQWLTIPVISKGAKSNHTAIKDIEIDWRQDWRKKHRTTLQQSYSKAPYFKDYVGLLDEFYERRDRYLADFTIDLTVRIARRLGIERTEFLRSSAFNLQGNKTERLLGLLEQVGATQYITGPAAKEYLNVDALRARNINTEFMVYDYPAYPQLHGEFDPFVSILDLLFHVGERAGDYIWRQG